MMFERFTDRARRVIVLAQEEARALCHNYIGTEHLLLGVIAEGEGVGAQALAAQAIPSELIRSQVEEITPKGDAQPPEGHIPFTPRAKKVCELSLREALQLGHNYIGTEHVLLGLIREGEGVACQVLVKLGAELTLVRKTVIAILSGNAQAKAQAKAGAPRLDEEVLCAVRAGVAEAVKDILQTALFGLSLTDDERKAVEQGRHGLQREDAERAARQAIDLFSRFNRGA